MADEDRYHCPRCGDDMVIKFAHTHEPICAWSNRIEAQDIETLLLELFP